jgi:hypothetical protein
LHGGRPEGKLCFVRTWSGEEEETNQTRTSGKEWFYLFQQRKVNGHLDKIAGQWEAEDVAGRQ